MFSHNFGGINYFQMGEAPRLLIISGTHGDEYGVIKSVSKSIEVYKNQLPSFLYIPEFSPSAVAQKTRHNQADIDLNRMFLETADDPEVLANKHIISRHSFDVCLNFHEDYERTEFYFYDTHALVDENRSRLMHKLTNQGFELYDGIDDPQDPVLSLEIKSGYYASNSIIKPENGMFSDWAIDKGFIKRSFIFEIPGLLPQEEKDRLVQHLFELYLNEVLQ